MKRLVLDCSIVMAWCFEDEANEYTDSILETLSSSEALVPAIWQLEIANVLLVGERRKRLKEADTARFLELLRELPIATDAETWEHALRETLAIGREQGLSSYDASYLELAMRNGIPIATQDIALRKAAKNCGVSVI